jgi:hypothetical protein
MSHIFQLLMACASPEICMPFRGLVEKVEQQSKDPKLESVYISSLDRWVCVQTTHQLLQMMMSPDGGMSKKGLKR